MSSPIKSGRGYRALWWSENTNHRFHYDHQPLHSIHDICSGGYIGHVDSLYQRSMLDNSLLVVSNDSFLSADDLTLILGEVNRFIIIMVAAQPLAIDQALTCGKAMDLSIYLYGIAHILLFLWLHLWPPVTQIKIIMVNMSYSSWLAFYTDTVPPTNHLIF